MLILLQSEISKIIIVINNDTEVSHDIKFGKVPIIFDFFLNNK